METMLTTILPGERALNPSLLGFVTQLSPYEGLTCNVAEWFAGANLTMFLDSTSSLSLAALDDQARAAAVLDRFRRWTGQGLMSGLLFTEIETLRVFGLQDNAVFMHMWGSQTRWLREHAPNLSWGVAPLPGESADLVGASTLGGGTIAVNRYSNNVTRAMRVAEFMSGPDVQRLLTIGFGFRPTIPALFTDPVVNQVYDEALLDSTRITNRPSNNDRYLAVSNVIYTAVNLILAGFADAQAAVVSMNSNIADLLNIDHFGPPQDVVWDSTPARTVMAIVAFLVVTTVALLAYLIWSHAAVRARRIPTMTLIGILSGSLIGSLTPLAYLGSPTTMTCQLRVALLGMGFVVMTSCMAAQDFRVYLIVSSPLRRVASDINRILWQSLIAVWVLEGALLGLWLGVDPMMPVDVIVKREWRYTGCVSKSDKYQTGMFVVQCLLCGALVIACIWLAARSRRVSPKTSRSTESMSTASYLIALGASAALIALSALDLGPVPHMLTITSAIALCVLGVRWAYILAQLRASPASDVSGWMGETVHTLSTPLDDEGNASSGLLLNDSDGGARAMVETKSLAVRFAHTARALAISPWMQGVGVALGLDSQILVVRSQPHGLVLSLRRFVQLSQCDAASRSFTAVFAAGILEVHAPSDAELAEWHARLEGAAVAAGVSSTGSTLVKRTDTLAPPTQPLPGSARVVSTQIMSAGGYDVVTARGSAVDS
ncbi:hypothetical protein, variant [Allomyces macrogynus ATCC 38327]|nr:hypothetical protein, variant [Allomyces macrogynus ATCC 38327]|eukprot:KNE64454.1 hypothetical protein, variant [Allomyces macrogynus ATCC 38327]